MAMLRNLMPRNTPRHIRASNAELVKRQPIVAVFVGGTSGIGEYSVLALARTHGTSGKGLRIYIVGRNERAAEKTIAECRRMCPSGHFEFVKSNDLALMKDVDDVCARIIKAEEKVCGTAKIDILVMTQAYLSLEPRNETKEGLDTLLSLLYYSRMRFVLRLLPALLASPSPTGAHIISVFGPGRDKFLSPSDLSPRDPKYYNFINMGSHAAYMKTFFFEELAKRYEGRLSLVHYFPSLVITDGFIDHRLPVWLRGLLWVVMPVLRVYGVPRGECGERVVFLASGRYPARGGKVDGEGVAVGSDGTVGGGAYRADWNGGVVPCGQKYGGLRREGFEKQVWDHTMEAFEVIESGRVFTE